MKPIGRKYYFEVDGMAVDENGDSCPVSMVFNISGLNTISTKDIEDVIEYIANTLSVNKEAIHLLTEEEYEEKYGSDDDGTAR